MVKDTDKIVKKKTHKIGGWFIDMEHYSLLTETQEQDVPSGKPDDNLKKDRKKKKKSLGKSFLAL